jgi:hypothetical protein
MVPVTLIGSGATAAGDCVIRGLLSLNPTGNKLGMSTLGELSVRSRIKVAWPYRVTALTPIGQSLPGSHAEVMLVSG